MTVTTEPPTVHRDSALDLHRPASGSVPPRLFDSANRGVVLGVVGVVVALAFEAIAVATAMPVAARELGGLRSYGLAFSIFLTTSLLGMVTAGEVSDRRGPVLPFVSASVIFAAGLAIAGAAPTMWVLVLARGVQGFGAGLNIVALYVVVARAFPESLRPRVFSAMSSGWIVPALIGPPIAGLLADHVSWRWVFLGVLPLIVIATALVLPHLRGIDGASERSRRSTPAARQAQPAPPRARCCRRHRSAAVRGTAADLGVAAACWSPPSPCWCPASRDCCRPARCASLAGCRPSSYSAGCSPEPSSGRRSSCRCCSSSSAGLATTLAGASLDRRGADLVARLVVSGQAEPALLAHAAGDGRARSSWLSAS